jgi:hypothetical protein
MAAQSKATTNNGNTIIGNQTATQSHPSSRNNALRAASRQFFIVSSQSAGCAQ